MQNVLTVEMIARYHSNQQRIGLFIAMNVSKSINQHNVAVAMVEDLAVAMVEDQVAMVEDLAVAMVEDLAVAMVEDLAAAMVEDLAVAMVKMTEVPDLVEETIDQEKCLMQNVLTVETIAKYHSNQERTDLFIATNVSKSTDKLRKFF